MLKNGSQLYLFYKIIRFSEIYAVFLQAVLGQKPESGCLRRGGETRN
jgi:hypothetical protein